MHKLDTKLIHSGEKPDPLTGAIAPVLYRTKTFAQKFGQDQKYQYSRGNNPTRSALEEKLADLEGCDFVTVFGSGNAATTAFFMSLNPGDHILFCQEIYGGTYRIMEKLMSRFGITASYVDFSTKESIKAGVKSNTKYLFIETPTNPSLHLIDLKMVNEVSQEINIPFVVDSTFAPPCCTCPTQYGAKVVIHSLSKYIAGHNDVLGGALFTNDEELHTTFTFIFRTVGAVLSPDECYRVLQGIKTLTMRWQRISTTAYGLAKYLNGIKQTKRVNYPFLNGNPSIDIARQQMIGGGGVISFELNEEYCSEEKIAQFINNTTATGVITYAESLASPETILAYPPLMSHRSLPEDVRKSLGISNGFFRLSIGFEDPYDIVDALIRGFETL